MNHLFYFFNFHVFYNFCCQILGKMSNIIIDNGQYSMKYGYADDGAEIKTVPNCIIRTADKRFHQGTDLLDNKRMSNLSTLSGLTFYRPQSHGQCYQWNLEHQIWDDAFILNGDDHGNGDFLKDSNLLYLGCVITLPKFQNMVDQIMFEEYSVGNYVRSSSSQIAPWMNENGSTEDYQYKPFQLVVDIGFDATWVVPMIHGLPYYKAVKRLPIAGRMLNGYLREVISFRHYNVIDEPVLIDSIKRSTCYVAEDYDLTLDRLTKLRKSPRALLSSDMSINYLLPDNKYDFHGHAINKSRVVNNNTNNNEEDQDMDGQSILLTDERFLIPEMLFHPQLSGIHKSGLISTIKESLLAVPELLRPLLANNLVCIGGSSNLPGLKERILKDLDQEVPQEAQVRLCEYDPGFDLTNFGFESGRRFFEKGGFDQVKMTREEYYEFGCEYAQEKFGYRR